MTGRTSQIYGGSDDDRAPFLGCHRRSHPRDGCCASSPTPTWAPEAQVELGTAPDPRQTTRTAEPSGISSRDQIMSIAAIVTRAQPCEAGNAGTLLYPCTAMPSGWK